MNGTDRSHRRARILAELRHVALRQTEYVRQFECRYGPTHPKTRRQAGFLETTTRQVRALECEAMP